MGPTPHTAAESDAQPPTRRSRTLRSETCDHVLILNASHAREILGRYRRHYNEHRPHQSRHQLPPDIDQHPATMHDLEARRLVRTRVLGGLINEYRYAA